MELRHVAVRYELTLTLFCPQCEKPSVFEAQHASAIALFIIKEQFGLEPIVFRFICEECGYWDTIREFKQ